MERCRFTVVHGYHRVTISMPISVWMSSGIWRCLARGRARYQTGQVPNTSPINGKRARIHPSSYPENVRRYPYRSYHNQEVAKIKKIPNLASDYLANAGLNVVYHSSHPKIGFLGEKEKSTKYLQEVLFIMDNYTKKKGLATPGATGDDSGCHLCLYLDAGAATQEWGRDDIVGYIVTSGPVFYKLCPPEQRKSWFEAFEKSKFVCVT